MIETKRASHISDEDTLIQKEVTNLLQQTRVPISQKDLVFHMEHVVLIRFGHMAQKATLTFEKYSQLKKDYRKSIKEDVAIYDFNGDVFAKVDTMIVRREKILTGNLAKVDMEGYAE